jgi:hypothetical protein
MEGRFCPPPDLTRLIDNLLPIDPHSTCPAPDNNQINAFSLYKHCLALHSKRLYSILKKEIQPLTDRERHDLRKWTKNDKSATNSDALPEFVDFAHEVGKHAIERDKMLRYVKENFDKKLKVGDDVALTPKMNDQLIKFFRKKFDDNIRAFQFSLNDLELFTTFPIHSFILFAIQIRSVFAAVNHLPRVELLYSLA